MYDNIMPGSKLESRLTRRAMVKSVALASVGGSLLAACEFDLEMTDEVTLPPAEEDDDDEEIGPDIDPSPMELGALNLTIHEYQTVTAITARIFPSDDDGLGALEAHAAHYIDRALGSHHDWARSAYVANIVALDDLCREEYGSVFKILDDDEQDAVLTRLTEDQDEGFEPSASGFFNQVRAHTQEGMFADPSYGGNRNFVGWELLGFPGIKMAYSEAEQELDYEVEMARQSAYSFERFQAVPQLDGESEDSDHNHEQDDEEEE